MRPDGFEGAAIDLEGRISIFRPPRRPAKQRQSISAASRLRCWRRSIRTILGPALKCVSARGGALFPHLYEPLDPQRVAWVRPLPLDGDGMHVSGRPVVIVHPLIRPALLRWSPSVCIATLRALRSGLAGGPGEISARLRQTLAWGSTSTTRSRRRVRQECRGAGWRLRLGFGFVECGTVTPKPQTVIRARAFSAWKQDRGHQPPRLQQ